MSFTLKSSGALSAAANQVVAARNARICSIQLITDGTNNASVQVFDNASASSGQVVCRVECTGADRYQHWSHDTGVEASNGLTVTVTGTGAVAIIHYALL